MFIFNENMHFNNNNNKLIFLLKIVISNYKYNYYPLYFFI